MFAQGGHLMSNKNANYLMRSHLNIFKKGYEEVHVSASKPKRFADKIYPVAFEQDENLLVCAPMVREKWMLPFYNDNKYLYFRSDKNY